MNLIIISSDLQTDIMFASSINNDTTIFNYTTPKPLEDGSFEGTQSTIINVLDTIGSNDIKRLALAYHQDGFNKLPFFNDNSSIELNQESKYKYFSNNLIELFKQVNTKTSSPLIVDILTCSLNNPEFKTCVEQVENDLGINIRYSLDQTGNAPEGNWVLESDGTDVKDVYFTDAINEWSGVLNSAISDPTTIDGIESDGSGGYKLTQDINWDTGTGTPITKTDYIALGANQIFDGQGYTIDMDTLTGCPGFFSCSIRNYCIIRMILRA